METLNFFSFNKKSDWQNGWAFNMKITDQGLQLVSTTAGEQGKALDKDFSKPIHGVYFTKSIDCMNSAMIWHKLIVESNVPEDTEIRISFFASDTRLINMKGLSTLEDEYGDVDEYIENADIKPEKKLKGLDFLWNEWLKTNVRGQMINPADALFHNAKGRYLWLRIEVTGNEKRDALIGKLRIYYPRTSYLSYLPAVYQEDPGSRDFLERFLSIFGTMFLEMEEQIDHVAGYFDIDSISGEYLKWIAGWLAIASNDSWEEEQFRRLVKLAPGIYKKRGTKEAIERIVEIYTGTKPNIIEYFNIKHIENEPLYKDLLPRLYEMDPYTFCVLVDARAVPTVQKQVALQKILDEEKPAFTEARLVLLQPWLYLDKHTYLGVNTYLSGFTSMRLDPGKSVLYNNVLVDEKDKQNME